MNDTNKTMACVNSQFELSFKNTLNSFLQQVLLRSLRVYVLKLILFSISVKSGISHLVFKECFK